MDWLISADDSGMIKYWHTNMNMVAQFKAHKDPIRGVSWAPTSRKFCTGSDDASVRIFDLETLTEEQVMRGHGADVKTVNWHPYKGLIASGSKDNQQPIKLWDPRSGKNLSTM